jgi:hypothetical protein
MAAPLERVGSQSCEALGNEVGHIQPKWGKANEIFIRNL